MKSVFSLVFACMFIELVDNFHINDKFYEVTAFNNHERSILYSLHTTNDSIIFLNGITNEAAMPIQIVVKKCCSYIFELKLQYEGIEYKKYDKLSDVSKYLDESMLDDTLQNVISNGFLKWEDLSMWIEERIRKYPNLKKIVMTNTYEKRELILLSIFTRSESPIVVLLGGEEGRDWMSPAIILNFINNLLENHDILLDYYNFYVIPIFNPDGYAYSMKKERFWRKNRKEFFPKKTCQAEDPDTKDYIAVGVNIERNWYFQKSLGHGDATECDSIYLGHRPLSEEEPKALATFLNKNATRLMAFFNIKGYGGRLITLPYADKTWQTNNHGLLMEIILAACDKVYQKHKATYLQGTTARFFCNSADWVKKNFNIPIVSSIFLKHKEEILMHASQIEPLTDEHATIVQEILIIGKEIYGPLFNYQTKIIIDYNIPVILLFMQICYTYILKINSQ